MVVSLLLFPSIACAGAALRPAEHNAGTGDPSLRMAAKDSPA
jgi:hypothetical protein